MEKRLFTSESVTEGHPDKICDQISDAVLDALYEQDPYSRVACETLTNTGFVMVMGEVTTTAQIDIPTIVRETVTEIGDYGFAYTALQTVKIPNGMTEIGNWVFCECKNLSNVTIPETVKIIGEGAFSDCAFVRISLPKRMSQIK